MTSYSSKGGQRGRYIFLKKGSVPLAEPSPKNTSGTRGDGPHPQGTVLYGKKRVRKEIPYDYYMAIYPVTNDQYKEFMLANGYGCQDYWSDEGWAWSRKSK